MGSIPTPSSHFACGRSHFTYDIQPGSRPRMIGLPYGASRKMSIWPPCCFWMQDACTSRTKFAYALNFGPNASEFPGQTGLRQTPTRRSPRKYADCPQGHQQAVSSFSVAAFATAPWAAAVLVDEFGAGSLFHDKEGSARLTVQDSSERIDDRNAFYLSAMAHVFGIQFLAPERTGGGDDGGVPIR
jgi:hypothetical protein